MCRSGRTEMKRKRYSTSLGMDAMGTRLGCAIQTQSLEGSGFRSRGPHVSAAQLLEGRDCARRTREIPQPRQIAATTRAGEATDACW
jgi:hypothetical protein